MQGNTCKLQAPMSRNPFTLVISANKREKYKWDDFRVILIIPFVIHRCLFVQKEITILVDVCNLFPWWQFGEKEKKSFLFKSAYSAELIWPVWLSHFYEWRKIINGENIIFAFSCCLNCTTIIEINSYRLIIKIIQNYRYASAKLYFKI